MTIEELKTKAEGMGLEVQYRHDLDKAFEIWRGGKIIAVAYDLDTAALLLGALDKEATPGARKCATKGCEHYVGPYCEQCRKDWES